MVQPVYLFNTANRKVELFEPINAGEVRMYSCGPTVYNFVHVGNLRAFVFADIYRRTLELAGYSVKHVMNITDVGHLTDDADSGEDKMLLAMRREGKTAHEIAQFYTDHFLQDAQDLNLLEPLARPKATECIAEQIDLVQKLEENGFTYTTSGGVYFDTAKYERYGAMAKLDIEGLRGGERVDLGEKRNKTDFALWKFSPKGEKRDMEWESPWGIGFPGWHIECSAMSKKYLGAHFDIHTGGIDHIPVHHTNELAQSECANGEKYANYWLHNEFLVLDKDTKISKSSGNFITLASVKERGLNPLALRYFFLQAHYRQQQQFTWEALDAAAAGLKKLQRKVAELEGALQEAVHPQTQERFMKALFNDFNTPQALAVVWEELASDHSNGQKLALARMAEAALGLELVDVAVDENVELPADILELINQRDAARSAKDWEKSDHLRDALQSAGYTVQDTAAGTKVSKS